MKKALALLLALMLCLSLCACGTATPPENSDAAVSETPEDTAPDSAVTEISLNEAVDSGNIQFTLTEIGDFEENYTMGSAGHYEGIRKSGYSFVKVSYTVKNIGKSEIQTTPVWFTMNYSDGYTFSADRLWYFSTETYQSNGTKGAWLNSCPALSPFDDAMECVAVFLLPNEVSENDEPWSITITVSGADFQYTIR